MTANGVHGDDDDDRSLNENAATAAQQLLAAVKVATPVRAWESSSGGTFDGFFRSFEGEGGRKFEYNQAVYPRDHLIFILRN